MKKYDEFGRPIYETAEEYNQAHRNAKQHTHTYETVNDCKNMHKTASQRYQKPFASTNGKSLVAVFVIVFVVIVSCFVGIMGGVVSMVENSDNYYEEEEYYMETYGDDSIPLPEGFESFTWDGQTYTLPTYFEDFLELDYTLSMTFEEDELLPPGFDDVITFYDENENLIAMVGVQNPTEDEIPLEKCTVNYFYIENPAAFYINQSAPDFEFVNGFTFDSYYHQLEAFFGEPYYHYEDHSEEGYYYDSYDWVYYGENETHYISVTFWNDEISDVSIRKIVWEQEKRYGKIREESNRGF